MGGRAWGGLNWLITMRSRSSCKLGNKLWVWKSVRCFLTRKMNYWLSKWPYKMVLVKKFLLVAGRWISKLEDIGKEGACVRQCYCQTSDSPGRLLASEFLLSSHCPVAAVTLRCPIYWFCAVWFIDSALSDLLIHATLDCKGRIWEQFLFCNHRASLYSVITVHHFIL
jgi:hypothetical protein